jgi:hypothetical protein
LILFAYKQLIKNNIEKKYLNIITSKKEFLIIRGWCKVGVGDTYLAPN